MNPVVVLSLGRVGLGAVSLARPDLAAKAFGLDAASNPQLGYMTRMFGSREVALGVLTLASRGTARRALLAVGVAVDGADVAAGVAGGNDGSLPRSTSALAAGVAGAAAVTGALALAGTFRRGARVPVGD
ncbi:hypothetical protein GCM10011519_04370 [Marmoricola endophyticus]|uniref:DUF4267 domain-containing protein n=1 Tax=Marmoricola endophyticus TaxID=2040280 RepID=A0A917BD34_9ACTN|nr:DUF4267 domain-containing protein [Marmoricola endophyticus]GGF34015.1 hypothetical protein GCM10011519_04370 [Marmoricola endophyticus]